VAEMTMRVMPFNVAPQQLRAKRNQHAIETSSRSWLQVLVGRLRLEPLNAPNCAKANGAGQKKERRNGKSLSRE